MILIVHELKTTLNQQITAKSWNRQVTNIRPHLLIFNKPTGTLKMQIWDNNSSLIAESDTLTISDLTTLNYAHKYYRFTIDAMLRKNSVYRLALVPGGGYSFAESGYIGWCNGWDLRRDAASYSPDDGVLAPLDFELWERKQIRRGNM